MKAFKSVGVIGGGAWGTALAQSCACNDLDTLIQAREGEVVASINSRDVNDLYLPNVKLHPELAATQDLADLADRDFILAVPPAQHLRSALSAFAPHARKGLPIVLCSKGIERSSLKMMTQVLAETVPQALPAVLSGPSFAADVSRGLPTAVTLAVDPDRGGLELGEALVAAIASSSFRPYLALDMVGAEIGGALKNVLAIACGIVEGKGLGRSAHSALITRGFVEMTRVAEAMGGKAETVAGLCGLGDLVLTCSSPQSRNMSVGLALGGGQTLEEALAGKVSVAEGVESAPAVRRLADSLGVETPIIEAVAAILAGEVDVDTAIERLLNRPLKLER